MVKQTEFFGFKITEKIALEEYVMLKIKHNYDSTRDDMTKINYEHDTLIFCKTILELVEDAIAYPSYDAVSLICKKAFEQNTKEKLAQLGSFSIVSITNLTTDPNTTDQFERAFKLSLITRMSPEWTEIRQRSKTYLFKTADFFNTKNYKECIELVSCKLLENHMNVYFITRDVLNISPFRLDKLLIPADDVKKFKSSTTGWIKLHSNNLFYAVPNLMSSKIIKISKCSTSISNGLIKPETIVDYWKEKYGIDIPLTEQTYFCLNENDYIYPSCCLLHEEITFKKTNEPVEMALRFLVEVKRVLCDNMNFLSMETGKISFSNGFSVKNLIKMKASVFVKLNNDKINVEPVKQESSTQSKLTSASSAKPKKALSFKLESASSTKETVLKSKDNQIKSDGVKKRVTTGKRSIEEVSENEENTVPVKKPMLRAPTGSKQASNKENLALSRKSTLVKDVDLKSQPVHNSTPNKRNLANK